MLEPTLFFEPHHQTYKALAHLYHRKTLSQIEKRIVFCEKPLQPSDYQTKTSKNNDAQQNAIEQGCKEALTLIQGPPGTGKTYVGQSIVRQLMATSVSLKMLIICHTNQALDHFLEGLIDFVPNIVRLGSQSKHPRLDPFNIRCLHQPHSAQLVKHMEHVRNQIKEGNGDFEKQTLLNLCLRQRLRELQQICDVRAVQHANCRIIGMTSTMAARSQTLLKLFGAGTVIVEEAAVMLEPQVIIALSKDVNRLVLIGDHKQLRPTTGSLITARHFNFEVSMFERLIIHQGVICIPLTLQRRMHPLIADLVRVTRFYEHYEDSEDDAVKDQVLINGRNVFFYDHQNIEQSVGSSRANIGEVRLVRAVCDRLLASGCPETDIVILTPYLAQVKQLADSYQGLTSATTYGKVPVFAIDNYQGREQRVVLLSLVRSFGNNSSVDPQIGFVAQENRICVALSRARAALFMFGNASALVKCSETWRRVVDHLMQQGAIGKSL